MAVVTPKMIGARVKRREDPRLIQGKATYVDDIRLPGMLHLAFRRSDIAHGIIKSIDVTKAKVMPGVELVITGAELKQFLPPMPIGTPFPSPDHYSVAVDRVRYQGEPVAVVVAADRYLARDAADAIEIEYETLPAVIDPEAAMQGKPGIIHDAFPNNLAVPYVPGGTGFDPVAGTVDNTAVDKAFAEAEFTLSQRMMNQRLAPNAMEPRGVVAHYEPGKDFLTIWSSTQNPHILKTFIAALTGTPDNQVRAIAPEVGGGFGCKINIYGEDYVAAALSKKLGKPLKWIEDRSEAFQATIHGRDILAYVDICGKNDGQSPDLGSR
jgi:carbon-monoxide dehydrogenase large subunit